MNKPARTLPHSLEAEASVLGGVLLRNDVLAQLDTLESDDFYDMRHRVVWQAMRNLEAKQKPIDVVTLEAEVERQGKLEALDGVAFFGELALRVPTVDNVQEYAEIVIGLSRARQLVLVAADIVERGYEGGLDTEAFISESIGKVTRIDLGKAKRASKVGELVKLRVAEYEDIARRRAAGEQVVLGLPSGIADLDAKVGGYPIGDLVLVAGRPGMGKTAMLMAAADACSAAGMGVHVFSPEGGWRMYADRVASRWSGVPVEQLRAARLTAAEMPGIGTALMKGHTRGNWIIDTDSGLSMADVIRRVRREAKANNTKLVVFDYIQIAKRPRGLEHDENAAIDASITAASQAAIADDITYLVGSQLNRKVEERTDKRPQLSDMRGSGSLEERPRLIVSPYRGAYYYDEAKPGVDYDCSCSDAQLKSLSWSCPHIPTPEEFAALVQVLVLKNNNGATQCARATWKATTTEMY